MFKKIIAFLSSLFSKKPETVQTQVSKPIIEPTAPTPIVTPTVNKEPLNEPVSAPVIVPVIKEEANLIEVKNYDNPKIKNAYPELPVIQYQRTNVSTIDTLNYLSSINIPLNVKIAAYAIFYIESGGGKSGINNNYEGVQADGSRLGGAWDMKVIATVVTPETMTGNPRRFCVFNSWKDPLDYLASRVQARGLYLSGTTFKYSNLKITNADDWARAYYKEWVDGDAKAEPSESEKKDILSVFNMASKAITK